MALSTNSLFASVEPVVRKHYGLAKNKKKAIFSQIFDVSKGQEPIRSAVEYGGPGQLVLKTENGPVQNMSILQGTVKTWNYSLFAGEITLSWELARDCKVREIKTVAQSLGRATALTPEYLAAQFLNRAFSSSYPATADGKELCATDHLIIGTSASNGANEASTPAALSETSLEDVLVALATMKGPDGLIVQVEAEKLLVPAALGPTAKKLSRSEKQVGSANNDPSIVKGIKVVENPYLDAGSTTYWYVLTDYQNGLFWEWDVEAEFMEDQSPTTLQKVYVAFFRCRYGCDDWRSIYGNAMS